jgi:RHS repeat-associated protein
MYEQHSNTESYNNPYKFNGKELDPETNLYYYGARYYDPSMSMWLSADPLAQSFQGWNPYNYTMQNPINLVDPTGMAPEDTDPPKGFFGRLWGKIVDACSSSGTESYEGGQIEAVQINKNVSKSDGGFFGWVNRIARTFGGDDYDQGNLPGIAVAQQNTHAFLNSAQELKDDLEPIAEGMSYIPGMKMLKGAVFEDNGMMALGVFEIVPVGRLGSAGVKVTSKLGLWSLTKAGATVIKNHKTFGTIYKSTSDGLWWAVDKAGHGGSKFKVFKEGKAGLEWFRDADEFGNFIINKHKGSIGTFIPWGQLSTIK